MFMRKKKLYCICGQSASGKDTLVNDLVNRYPDKLKTVCSYTNRPKRDNETEGKEHYFVSKVDFDILMKTNPENILAYTKICSDECPNGYEYMALDSELDKANVYIIDPRGIKYLKEKYSDKYNIVVIYIHANYEQRKARAKASRSDFEAEFEKRAKAENERFRDFIENREYDYIVFNSDDSYQSSSFMLAILLDVI